MSKIVRTPAMKAFAGMVGLVLLGAGIMESGRLAGTTDTAQAGVTAPIAAAGQPVEKAAGFTDVAKAVRPAVVNITPAKVLTRQRGLSKDLPSIDPRNPLDSMEEFFKHPRRFGPRSHGPEQPDLRPHGGMGSGVIVSPDGHIITNNHVVDGAKEVQVTLPDKREFTGKVIGSDPKTDLALVKIDKAGGLDLPYVPWGDSSKLQVGEYVLAIGNPFGLNSTVTLGIVSALGRGRMGITQYEDWIQTDAAINPGNSGGALVNTRGELVGINTAIFSQTGGYQGVGFAVPASMAKPVYESLAKTGKVVRGFLGVGIQDVTLELAKSFGLKEANGALVSDVVEDGPAEHGGIKQGDVILQYDGKALEDPAALQRAVTRTPVGSKVALKIMRDGQVQDVTVTIGEQADAVKTARVEQEGAAESALAGLEIQNLDQETARELGLRDKIKGVVITGVEPGSVADQAGLQEGDVIQEINRHPVRSVKEFEKTAASLKKDQKVLLLINRRGSSLFLTVTV